LPTLTKEQLIQLVKEAIAHGAFLQPSIKRMVFANAAAEKGIEI
jgi:hypothetical protein